MPRIWTPEQRLAQAVKILNWEPWKQSTGPKTKAGKDRTKMNAHKHGANSLEARILSRALTLHAEFLRHMALWIKASEQAQKSGPRKRTIKE